LDIHQIFVGFSACRTSAGAVYLDFFGIQTGLVIRGPPVCVVYPTAPLKVVNFFQLENSSNPARNWAPTDVQAIDFRRKSCSFCTGEEGCPLPSRLVGAMLRFDFEMQTPNFHTARIQGASQGI